MSFRNLVLNQFCLAMCEGVNLKSGRKIEDTSNLSCRFKLGINDHGKAQLISQIAYFFGIVRITNTSNGSSITDTFCDGTAEQI